MLACNAMVPPINRYTAGPPFSSSAMYVLSSTVTGLADITFLTLF
jgi:hypothetical protein